MLSNYRTLTSTWRKDESGSVLIVMTVVLVISIGLVALLVHVNGSLELTRNDQNRNNAFQFANAGIDQALFRIDSKNLPTTPTGTYVPTLSGTPPKLVSFTETLTVGSSRFDITAEKNPPDQDANWKVRSLGTDPSGRQRQAVADITADVLFPNGFFTLQDFSLTGNQTSPVAYDSSTCVEALPSCELPTPIDGFLGTNSEINGSAATIDAFIAHWKGFNMYGRATQAAADEACARGRCGTAPKVRAITNQLQIQMPTPPANAQGCPNGGVIGTRGTTTTIAPGDYICDNLNLNGTINISSGTGTVRIWANKTFSATGGSVINRAQVPARFQIYYPPQPEETSSSICDAEIWALMYTPGLWIDCNGSHQPSIYGAVVANLHAGTGNHFDFHWDIRSLTVVSDAKYVIRDWRECPPGITDC